MDLMTAVLALGSALELLDAVLFVVPVLDAVADEDAEE